MHSILSARSITLPPPTPSIRIPRLSPSQPVHVVPLERSSLLARLLDPLLPAVHRTLALGLLRHLLVRLGICRCASQPRQPSCIDGYLAPRSRSAVSRAPSFSSLGASHPVRALPAVPAHGATIAAATTATVARRHRAGLRCSRGRGRGGEGLGRTCALLGLEGDFVLVEFLLFLLGRLEGLGLAACEGGQWSSARAEWNVSGVECERSAVRVEFDGRGRAGLVGMG